jgi:glycosyltransferase involved in cell wall biosynthesis
MRIAFYAPMKPPTDPTPSGDRRIARLLMAALRRSGHEVFLASTFRSRDGDGHAEGQQQLRATGLRLADRFIARAKADKQRRPDLWFTYHLYYKAPDWLGPRIAGALGIPYVVAEASVASKREVGPWAIGHAQTLAALGAADAVIGVNEADRAGVLPALAHPSRWVALRPFIDVKPFAAAAKQRRHGGVPVLVVLAMMREGDKLASYRVLGDALARLQGRRWRLVVIGDGPARRAVSAALAPVADRTTFLGARDLADIPALLAEADLFVWPAVNEAFGMALIEAQAAGLPAVVGTSGGIPDIVVDGITALLAPVGDDAAFATAVASLLDAPERRRAMSLAAAERARLHHDIAGAAQTLDRVLRSLVGAAAA